MDERRYLRHHHQDLLPQLLVRCTVWLWNKSQLQNPIAHTWSCWKLKAQQWKKFLGDHQLTHCPYLKDWQGYNSDIPCVQNSCGVLHANTNMIPPAPLFIHSFKWQLWSVNVKLQKLYRFQRKKGFSCFITSLLTLTERPHSYWWSCDKTMAARCSCCPRVWEEVRNMDLREKPNVWDTGNVQINP